MKISSDKRSLLVFLVVLVSGGAAIGSTVVDCTGTAKVISVSSKKSYPKRLFQGASGPVLEVVILESGNSRVPDLLGGKCRGLKGKHIFKLDSAPKARLRPGEIRSFNYQYSSPRPANRGEMPRTRIHFDFN